ncbi:MAG: response regulator [Candidatus Hydrogenedentota bacterium]|nr:MAG: response regulator [Candidatus Hydrogenedentota bacterium]
MNAGTPRILVVDDEAGIREGCRINLELEGYEVDVAEDGLAGLKLFKERRNYAVVLVDLKMPRMGGLELIEKIRELDEDIVMLVITAYATLDTAVEATKRGAYGYIAKPFTPDELLLPIKRGIENWALSLEARRLREERENRLLEVAFERSKSNTIIKCMTDGVLVINRDKQIVLWNEAACRIIPGCEDLLLPAPLSALCDSEELVTFLNDTEDGDSNPVIISREITLGENVFMVQISPVIEPGRPSSGAVAVFRDITALKKLETTKSMFVSMVAHEVKRPLGIIEGYLDLVVSGMAGEDPKKQMGLLERSLVRARTLRTMVSELMNLTAMETGKLVIKRTPLDIQEIVIKAVESCRDKAKEKGIELSLDFREPSEHEPVLADGEAMLSVFANLIDNAVKYTLDGGHVSVQMEHTGNYVKIIVRDDGIGITPEEKERIFEEFFRAKNKYTAKIPGTGLGLTVAKRFVEMHQGKITVETAPGKGSVFTVYLPKWGHTPEG